MGVSAREGGDGRAEAVLEICSGGGGGRVEVLLRGEREGMAISEVEEAADSTCISDGRSFESERRLRRSLFERWPFEKRFY